MLKLSMSVALTSSLDSWYEVRLNELAFSTKSTRPQIQQRFSAKPLLAKLEVGLQRMKADVNGKCKLVVKVDDDDVRSISFEELNNDAILLLLTILLFDSFSASVWLPLQFLEASTCSPERHHLPLVVHIPWKL
jgi:hypothetical protein